MSGYEKQGWTTPYAAPQGQGGYQQQPPHQTQQLWNQQPYGQQQGVYQAPSSYTAPPGYGAPPQGPYGSPQPQQSYGAPPYPQGQYRAPPPQQQWSGAPPPLGPPGGTGMRRSVCFKFSGTKQTILNSQVMDPQGRVPFNVVSDKKHTTVSASDGTTLAVMDWNHSTPVMHYGGKKLPCKDWIKLDKSKKIRVFNYAGKEYHWITRDETVYLEPADRPGFHVFIWRDPTGVVEVEAFQELLIVPGLLEAAIVAVVIMQSNHKLGDHGSDNSLIYAIGGAIGANIGLGNF